MFSRQVLDVLMPGVENISFNTTEAVFDFIDKNIGDEKLVLVIDELPYWAEKDDALFPYYRNISIQSGIIKN